VAVLAATDICLGNGGLPGPGSGLVSPFAQNVHQRIGSFEMVAKPDQIGSEMKGECFAFRGRGEECLQYRLPACNNIRYCCSLEPPVAKVDIFALFSEGTVDLPFQQLSISDCGNCIRSFCCRAVINIVVA
jgi:hypothetical protein